MMNFARFCKITSFAKSFGNLSACLCRLVFRLTVSFSRLIIFHLNPFWVQLCYFPLVSFLGLILLKGLKPKPNSFTPNDIDMFFMSVSAVTVSSMSTVEMEVFSNTQLMFITILMLVGSEVFTSMLGLQFVKSKFLKFDNKVNISLTPRNTHDPIELGLAKGEGIDSENHCLKYNSMRYLCYVVLVYLVVVHVGGSILVTIYLNLVPSAMEVLNEKGLNQHTFSIFVVVSTFASCGFVPTNENMVSFKKNSGLLLLLIPQALLGNTLFPSCLRFIVWLLGKVTKREEFEYMLRYTREIGYLHLLPSLHSFFLVFTVFVFILGQFVLFGALEWESGSLDGMNSVQKIIATLFQSVNSRHTGESIVDLSIISPPVLVMFAVMMYLPPYTSFLPLERDEQCEKSEKQTNQLLQNSLFAPISYLSIFVILICITERKKMKDDPLNFSVFNVLVEVISAYGNVGYSTGYSCERQIHLDTPCNDKWYGLSGRMSNEGKLVIILVMFFGRLKKFCIGGGKAWKLL